MKGYTIYLIHIEPRYRHAGHYLGICRNGRDVADRFKEHYEGRGAVLTQHARRAGCQLQLARVWFNCEFAQERRMKGRSLLPLCPICKEKANEKGIRTRYDRKGRGKKNSPATHQEGNEARRIEDKQLRCSGDNQGSAGVDRARSFYLGDSTLQHTAAQ